MAGNLTAMIASIFSGSAVTADPYYEYTTLLLPGNGTNGAQNNTFLDGSTNNFTITRNGNTTQGTFSPFSQTGWGNYFDGSGDYLTVPDNAALELGTSNFTIELWVYPTVFTANYLIGKMTNSLTASGFLIRLADTTGVALFYASSNGSSWDIAGGIGSVAVTLNAWNHIAVSRSGSSFRLWVNGSSGGTATSSSAIQNNTAVVGIGDVAGGGGSTTGYISNVRIVNGSAVYDPSSSTITVPTAPLTAITNTALLTCQSNRFIDASTNNFTITRNGDTRVVAFSPFNPTASWSAATYGGSGYFDGNGDYLSVTNPSTNIREWWTTDYTIEAWVFPLDNVNLQNSNNDPTMCGNCDVPGNDYWSFGPINNGVVRFKYYNGSPVRVDSTQTITINQWNHVAMVKTSSGITIFVNGVSSSTTAISGTPQSSVSVPFTIGANYNKTINAYVSNLRIVKGTAVYTGNFTPPTAPLTAITNTSLLLNFTNAGIYDATSKNDLETVGNAQISTAISAKWGSGSIYLDGTNSRFNFSPANLFILGTAAFTFETWFYPVAAGGSGTIFTCKLSGGRGFYLVWSTGSVLRLLVNAGTNWNVDISSSALTLNTWHHIAVTRSGSTFYLLADGSLANSQGGVSGEICSTVPIVKIGSDDANGSLMTQSYLQDTRFTNGVARYTGAYTVPTAAFPTQ